MNRTNPLDTRTERRPQGTRRSQRIQTQQPCGGQDQKHCTQKCLLGLVQGGFLDAACPNVALHRREDGCDRSGRAQTHGYAGIRHPVEHAEWLRLLWKQLERSLDDGITALRAGGARSVLFRVTMLAYGYTFVSKGTVRAFIPDLKHEAAVYARLRPLQGVNVPVFLGAIDLRSMDKVYYYDFRVYVTMDRHGRLLGDKAVQSLRAMHQEGVMHKDARLPNMLFSPETNGVVVVDFERSELLVPGRPSAPGKPVWELDATGGKKRLRYEGDESQVELGFRDDVFIAKAEFAGIRWC